MSDQKTVLAVFPAAGSGPSSYDFLEVLSREQSWDFEFFRHPSVDVYTSEDERKQLTLWAHECASRITYADKIMLFGHSMGGLEAVLVSAASPLRSIEKEIILLNTPKPTSDGKIPTMSSLSNRDISCLLEADKFPAVVLEDTDLLDEVCDQLRAHAMIADIFAECVKDVRELPPLTCLSSAEDVFIPASSVEKWREISPQESEIRIISGPHSNTRESAEEIQEVLISVAARKK